MDGRHCGRRAFVLQEWEEIPHGPGVAQVTELVGCLLARRRVGVM